MTHGPARALVAALLSRVDGWAALSPDARLQVATEALAAADDLDAMLTETETLAATVVARLGEGYRTCQGCEVLVAGDDLACCPRCGGRLTPCDHRGRVDNAGGGR